MIAYHENFAPDVLRGSDLDYFLARGWYRMHQHIFTTTHLIRDDFCRVHWLRFPLNNITSHTSHRRIRASNKSFTHVIQDMHGIRQDHQELHARYREHIDFDGAPTIQHALFGDEGIDRGVYETKCISVFHQQKLVAGGYFDVGSDSGTSILHFYDPHYSAHALGKYLILLTIDFLRSQAFTFYYPGYVVAGIAKMDYKLFLGKEAAQYFEAESQTWQPFDERILVPEILTSTEKMKLMLAFEQ
jgi:arginyl-tRNA--protein-N-Asp/Glu arginylyltransferase